MSSNTKNVKKGRGRPRHTPVKKYISAIDKLLDAADAVKQARKVAFRPRGGRE